MRALLIALALVGACKFDKLPSLSGDGGGGDDGGGSGSDACVGIGCNVEECNPGEETKITGRVLLPNATTPMANVDVYVPATDPGLVMPGATCAPCAALPGNPVVRAKTGVDGTFTLVDVPSGDNIPLVVQIGKWRRQYTIPMVPACMTTTVPDERIRLPRNRAEGDLPRIAMTTGSADALECVMLKIGVDLSEFGTLGGPEAIHMFAPPSGSGANKFAAGPMFANAQQLWGSTAMMMAYDTIIFGCEGQQFANMKPQTAMLAVKGYADGGGRIFASHYQNIWIGGELNVPSHAPPDWPAIARFVNGTAPSGDTLIQTNVPGGQEFAEWQMGVAGGVFGHIQMQPNTQRSSVQMLDPTMARWVARAVTEQATNFDFATPTTAQPAQKCGRVAFSDMHQGTGAISDPATPFPNHCNAAPLTPQDLALTYLLFDLQRCVAAP